VYKAYGLMHQLDRFQGGSRLFVVAFGKTQQRLAASGASRLQIMAQRRLMLKTAEVLAGRLGAAALVTGDSLGQVSSQTLANLTALDDAVGLPILRPLIGRDKVEIMAEARRIRTLALSERGTWRPRPASTTCAGSRPAWKPRTWRRNWPAWPRSTAPTGPDPAAAPAPARPGVPHRACPQAAGPLPQITASEPVLPFVSRYPEAHRDVVPGMEAIPNAWPVPVGSV